MDNKKEKKKSDFRYDTGEARVPWAAVGEHVNVNDIAEMIKFLIPGDDPSYSEQLKVVTSAMEELHKKGSYAPKLSMDSNVKKLEEAMQELLNVKHACFITNATAGFEIGFKFAGLKPGDEVIAPAITFLSTIHYPLQVGAKVVLADVDPITLNISPEDIRRKITPRTKAIIPVHIGGYPCDMDAIMEIAREHDLMVVEDAAHGFGGYYKGKALGAIGDFGSYSFHEVKNITSFGEGGIVVTNSSYGEDFAKSRFGGFDISNPIDKWLYDVVALKGKGGHYTVAGNHSSTEIQAVGLLTQMERLPEIIEARRKNAEYLNKRFSVLDEIIPSKMDTEDIKSTHHLYLFQLDYTKLNGDIQDFKKKMTERGIVQIAHFAPLYRFSYLKQLGYDTDAMQKTCPNAEEAFLHKFTHLPLYPLTDDQLEYMADNVIEAVKEMKL
ncbi:MAG: DegT/DnrJ/EryC1/StrS family aminotransferase [Dysgonamonadaceae bacterium]|nr:DegT/DnrJ/EryC1/StrS family aminotransferase [Dysgonamonadaceae bacterium]MDD4729518.1 DegT/DnrJ/EryC1/StrS family aminotransferase [Dysgonamonadaceae bacterium]